MKLRTSLAIMSLSLNASASVSKEESLFTILEKNGIVVQYNSTTADSTKKLELQSIRCFHHEHSGETSCDFTDAGRPMESGTIGGSDAAEIYEAMILSGAGFERLFGKTQTGLSVLRCQKNTLNHKSEVKFQCQTLKPL